MTNNFPDKILNEIHERFRFLFERKFVVDRVYCGTMDEWLVVLSSVNYSVKIGSDRSDISLDIIHNADRKWFTLYEVVYFLSEKKEFIGVFEREHSSKNSSRINQIQRLAEILYRYLDKIDILFGEEFIQNLEKLQSIRKEAGELNSAALDEELRKMMGH
jgi:hypothetical protein